MRRFEEIRNAASGTALSAMILFLGWYSSDTKHGLDVLGCQTEIVRDLATANCEKTEQLRGLSGNSFQLAKQQECLIEAQRLIIETQQRKMDRLEAIAAEQQRKVEVLLNRIDKHDTQISYLKSRASELWRNLSATIAVVRHHHPESDGG